MDSINTTFTDANGNYTMQSFAGSYMMRASYPGYGSASPTETLTTGTQTVNFQLQGSVAGQFYVSPTGDDGNDGIRAIQPGQPLRMETRLS